MTHKTFLYFIITIFSSLTVFAQDTLDLDDAIAIGMENNFQLKVAKNNKELAGKNMSTAYGEFLPDVSLNGGYNGAVRNTSLETLSGDQVLLNGAKSTNLSADITARWVIFEGMRKMNAYNRYKIEYDLSNLDYKAELENYMSLISKAYFDFLVEQERLSFLKKTIDFSVERLSISKSQFEVGKTSKVEYLAAQVDYNTDRSALFAQQERLNTARLALNQILARDLNMNFAVSGVIQINNNLSDSAIVEEALQKNTQLLIAKKVSNASDYSLAEVKSGYSPNVSLFGTYSYNRSTAEVGFAKLNQATGPSYGVSLTWPLFNGFNNTRATSTARIALENNQIKEEESTQRLKADIDRVYFNYKNTLEVLKLEEANLLIARENLDISLDRYKFGNSNALQLRDAQRNALLAENRFLNAAYQVKLAEIELQRLGGNLIE